jgi:hypothetical protein
MNGLAALPECGAQGSSVITLRFGCRMVMVGQEETRCALFS